MPQAPQVVDFQPTGDIPLEVLAVRTPARVLSKRLLSSPWLWFALGMLYFWIDLTYSDRLPRWMVIQVGF